MAPLRSATAPHQAPHLLQQAAQPLVALLLGIPLWQQAAVEHSSCCGQEGEAEGRAAGCRALEAAGHLLLASAVSCPGQPATCKTIQSTAHKPKMKMLVAAVDAKEAAALGFELQQGRAGQGRRVSCPAQCHIPPSACTSTAWRQPTRRLAERQMFAPVPRALRGWPHCQVGKQ